MKQQDDGEITSIAEPEEPASGSPCRQCQTAARLVRTLMDSATGRSVRMLECADCGARTWED